MVPFAYACKYALPITNTTKNTKLPNSHEKTLKRRNFFGLQRFERPYKYNYIFIYAT